MDIDSLDAIPGLAEGELLDILDELADGYYTNSDSDISASDNTLANYCINCKEDNLVEDRIAGIIVCQNCGMVNSGILDCGAEWRGFSDVGNNERCSFVTNHFLPQSSLGTSVGGPGKSRVKILNSWNAMPYKERSRNNVLKEIERRCRSANIVKKIEDDAKIIYINISECKHTSGKNKGKSIIIRGKNRKSLIAACVYIACKRSGEARSPKNIANIFNLTSPDITKGRKTLSKLMQLIKMDNHSQTELPEHFIPRYCKELKLKQEFIDKAISIAKNIKKLNIAPVHTPLSIATGCILLLVKLNNIDISKKDISVKFGVSEVTISNTFEKIKPYENIIIDDNITNDVVKKINDIKKNTTLPPKLKKKYAMLQKEWEKNK